MKTVLGSGLNLFCGEKNNMKLMMKKRKKK
jgi:hypothetical protein